MRREMPRWLVIGCGIWSVVAFSTVSFVTESVAETEWTISPTVRPSHVVGLPGDTVSREKTITLDEAASRLNELSASTSADSRSNSVVLRLLSGVHRLSKPFEAAGMRGNVPGRHVHLSGPLDKSAIVSGGMVLTKSDRVTDPTALARLPQQSRDKVVQFDLRAEGVKDFGEMIPRGHGHAIAPGSLELFYLGKPMTMARWPNKDFALIESLPDDGSGNRSFYVKSKNLSLLQQEPELMVSGYFSADWAFETLPVETVNSDTGTLSIKPPWPKLGVKKGQRYFIQNALSELDQPGEWYLNRASGILYFWPPAELRPGDVEVSRLASLLVLKGQSDVRIDGITFESARGDALVIHGGSGVVIENSTIRNVGGRAAEVAGSNHLLRDLDVYDTGEGGIYLWGGDRQTLQSGGLSVEESRFRRFARLSSSYRPAIQLDGVGSKAVGNIISDAPHTAILFYGNDHLIAYNEIFDVAKETGDVGAIYTGRDWTARGTVIRNNFLHDIRGPGLYGSRGVYLDDQTSGIIVKGNLFVRVNQPVFIGGGRDNLIEDNVMLASSPAIHLDARGLTWQSAETKSDADGWFLKKLTQVPYDKPLYSARYPHLAGILGDQPGAPKYNIVRRNLVIGGESIRLEKPAENWVVVESWHGSNEARIVDSTALTNGVRAGSFFLKADPTGSRSDVFVPPVGEMDCVAERWRQADLGRRQRSCTLH